MAALFDGLCHKLCYRRFKGILCVNFCTLLDEGIVNEKSGTFEEISSYKLVNIEHFAKLHICKINQP